MSNRMIGRKKIEFQVDANGCYNCTSHQHNRPRSYPSVNYNGKCETMARHIYSECFGDVPDGMVLRHKCDNYSCINPEHLEIGTVADNRQDMAERGRSFRPHGEKNGQCKYSDAQINNVIQLKGSGTSKAVSVIVGMSDRYVRSIWNGERRAGGAL